MVLGLFELVAFILTAAFLAGLAGSTLGLGGGIFLVPYLTLVIGLDVRAAIAARLVGVIATSSGAASVYVRDRLTNLRLGMFLEVATTIGAIAGAFLTLFLSEFALYFLFGIIVAYTAVYMLRTREGARERAAIARPESAFSTRLKLSSYYFDQEDQAVYRYRVDRPVEGFSVGVVAGAISGLLGVGGGFVKVPAMNTLMRVPMKVAVATSNFMLGVTAAASAFIYYSRGIVDPTLAAMIIVGAFLGTSVGTRILERTPAKTIRATFAVVLVGIAVAMIAGAVRLL